MKKNQAIVALIVLAALAGLFFWGREKFHFDFAIFRSQLALADWRRIGIATACIYLGYVIRSVRWAMLLRHNKRIPAFSLLGTQVMGFTAVALIGRVADPVRPYLVSRKTGLPLSSQIAVYIVERLFDAGSMALIFSVAVLWIPESEVIKATSHLGILSAVANKVPFLSGFVVRFGGLMLTCLGALFLIAVRLGGGAVAAIFERLFGFFSKSLGVSVGDKIRTFRTGLDTMRSFSDFATTAGLSLVMWMLISLSYLETMRAFTASHELTSITAAKCVLLMVVSGGASILQLPVLGWFTQIGLVAAALSSFFAVGTEAATACATTLLLVAFLAIVPVGLIWSQLEHVSLRKIAAESEQAKDGLAGEDAPANALD